MQSKKEKSETAIDIRPLPELYESATPEQRKELRFLLATKMLVTSTTVYNWTRGLKKPGAAIMKEKICRIVNSTLDIRTTSSTLFNF